MFQLAATSSIARITILLIVFGLVVTAAFVVMTFLSRRSLVRSELRELTTGGLLVHGKVKDSLRASNDTAWAKLADAVERAGLSLADTQNERLRAKLVAAGFRATSAPRIYTLVRLALVFVLPLGYVALAYSGDQPPSFFKTYAIGVGLALLGLYMPNLYVRARADRRREEIINGFPDCLDLILVCVEAGLGIEAAMDRVGREMVHSHPLVAELISVTTLQLRAGASREDAFRRMADTAGVDEIRSFTTLLIQSDKLGTSISTTLRVYAAEMRERRRMRAEEKAHRLPVLISIPLVVCMLPTMIGVLMLPAAVRVVRQILPLLAGG
ncbi:type II secretion system F family protein [Novosphingobium sp. Gsoil 351]|uniref:type II secretion system F family protein n=1 Tax=Novosphingobium sp. Gsoil 351 TaxID=2675225 RepID=UPI0012B4EB2E|nr:type II secretion system F family protein [Novosphingobium sp. Gsoil 351]QGN54462.1 type II secretion system F family protein [Novosphingobium sp. Gsoil 351]